MAEQVCTAQYAMINSVDLSDHVTNISLTLNADDLDASASGDLTKVSIAGLKSWSLSIEFLQDYASGEVDATCFPLIGAAAFPIVVRASTSAVGVTNPSFSGNAILTSYPPINNSHGELAKATCTFSCAGDLSRSTT